MFTTKRDTRQYFIILSVKENIELKLEKWKKMESIFCCLLKLSKFDVIDVNYSALQSFFLRRPQIDYFIWGF